MDLLIVTQNGTLKRTSLDEYRRQGRGGSGITGIGLADGDQAVAAAVIHGNPDVIIVTAKGVTIRVSGAEVRSMGRTSKGVRGINLKDGDKVVGLVVAG